MPLADATTKQRRRTRKSISRSYTRPRRKTVRKKLVDAAVETVTADPRLSLPRAQQEGLADTKTRKRRTKRRKRIAREAKRVSRQFGPTSGPDITPRAARAMGDELRAQRAQRRAERRRDLTPEERAELPGAALRGDAFHDYQLRVAEAEATNQAGLGGALEGIANVMTLGIPSAFRAAAEDPSALSIGGAAASIFPFGVAARGARLGTIAARAAAQGEDVGEVVGAAARQTGRGTRFVRLNDSTIQFYSSPSRITRAGQRMLDTASEYLAAKGRGGPLSATRRVPKQAAKRIRKEQSRAGARQSANIELIKKTGGGSKRLGRDVERPERTGFFYEAQMPADLRGGKGLRMIRDDLNGELKSLTPEQIARDPQRPVRLQNEIKKLDKAISSSKKYDERALDAGRALMDDRLDILVRAGRLDSSGAQARTTLLTRRLEGAEDVPGSSGDVLRYPEFPLDEQFRPTVEMVESLQDDLARAESKLDELTASVGPREGRIADLSRQYEDALAAGDSKRMSQIQRRLRSERNRGPTVDPVNRAVQLERIDEQRRAITGLRTQIAEAESYLPVPARFPNRGEIYIGHREGAVRGGRRMGPGGVSTTGTVGKTRAPQGTGQQNTLGLYSQGRLRTDPDVIVEDWQAAQSYEFNNIAKDELARMGEPIDPTVGVKEGYILVNPQGHKIPRSWRKQDNLEGEGFTDKELVSDLDEYINNYLVQDPVRIRSALDEMANGNPLYKEVRQVREGVASQFFKHLIDPKIVKTHPFLSAPSKVGKTMDAANDILYMSLIYSNPGYIPANIVGNLAFNALHQGAFTPINLARAGQLLARGPKDLRRMVLTETGQGATPALASSILKKPARIVGRIPDDGPRVAAFLHEAAKAGVISKVKPVLTTKDYQKLRGLFGAKNRPLLNDISDRAVEAMVNFERLSPAERAVAKRFLFVWPWIRGATAYPFRFAADYPLRAGALGAGAYAATQNDELTDRLMDNMPPWLRGAVRVGEETINGETFPTILNTGPISPISTAYETVSSALGRPGFQSAGEFLNPGLVSAIQVAMGKSPWWSQIEDPRMLGPLNLSAAQQGIGRLVPQAGLAGDLISPPDDPGMYPGDVSRLGRLARASRVVPYPIDVGEARESARLHGTAPSYPRDPARAARGAGQGVRRDRQELAGASPARAKLNATISDLDTIGDLTPEERTIAKRAISVKYQFEEALDEASGRNGKMNRKKAAEIGLGFIEQYAPEWSDMAREGFAQLETDDQYYAFYQEVREALREKFPWSDVEGWLKEQRGDS